MPVRLPPLNWLRAFEAVVRCGSLAAAAAELGVVRGAVSQHITALEKHLGVNLFDRAGQRLVANERGRRLAQAVGAALDIVGRAVAELSPTGAPKKFRLGVLTPMAIWWLVPRLPDLEAAGLGFEVEIVQVPVTQTLGNGDGLDALILGSEYRASPDIVGVRVMNDRFGPVASPAMAEALALADGPAALGNAVALSSRSVPDLWAAWFRESGNQPVRFARRQEFEDLALAIAAARSGLGVAVAPWPTIEADLASGALVAPFGFVERPAGYTFCYRAFDRNSREVAALQAWLLVQGTARQKI